LSGSGFSAQIFGAPGANRTYSSLTPASPIIGFGTGAEAGFFNATVATLSGVPLDAPVATLMVRVWDNQGGTINSWAEAVNAIWTPLGQSRLFNVFNIGGNVNPPPNLVGLESFNLLSIPEPTTIALGCLAVAGLLILGRRKSELATAQPCTPPNAAPP